MDIRNCRSCGKMFNYITGEPVCPNCKEAMEQKFQEVKKFVQENRVATLNEICEKCDVDVKMVRKWVREERLFFADDSPVKINCEMCGTQISTGRFCDKCRKNAANNFDSVVAKAAARKKAEEEESSRPSGQRMYTFKD